jgi:thiol:disulfide interchange protein DsbC
MKKKERGVSTYAGAITLTASLLLGGYGTALQADQKAEIQQIKQSMTPLLREGDTIDEINPSPIESLYEVMVGPELFYVSKDGKYLFNGKLFDLASRTDLSTPKISKAKAQAIAALGDENMVIFGPQDAKHTVTVFTDIDCGYCRKLHNEIDEYNNLGIRVRYLMYPRAGLDSPSYDKAVSVWCAEDRNEAMTRSKAGEKVPQKSCDNPVKTHMALASKLGVNGTPAVFLSDGEMLPGYVPAARMAAFLKDREKK